MMKKFDPIREKSDDSLSIYTYSCSYSCQNLKLKIDIKYNKKCLLLTSFSELR